MCASGELMKIAPGLVTGAHWIPNVPAVTILTGARNVTRVVVLDHADVAGRREVEFCLMCGGAGPDVSGVA
jgi:hypothetical protein